MFKINVNFGGYSILKTCTIFIKNKFTTKHDETSYLRSRKKNNKKIRVFNKYTMDSLNLT